MPNWMKTSAEVEKEKHESACIKVRRERNRLLTASDYAVLPDSSVSDVDAWKAYRQTLRDVPDQDGFPLEVTWPEPPA